MQHINELINDIFANYIEDIDEIVKMITVKFKKYTKHVGRNVQLFYKKNTFIKIENRTSNQKKYEFHNNKLYLGKFPKEIILNKIINNILPNNIIQIKKYYFNNKTQILIMNNIDITLGTILMKNINSSSLNYIFIQIFLIIAILQENFKFMHNDLTPNNILLKKNDIEYINYELHNNVYKIKCEYIPVLIDFATSSIHKINNYDFIIYDTESLENMSKYNYVKNINDKKYRWYILDNNIYDPVFDIKYLLQHVENKHIDIINEYKKSENKNLNIFIEQSNEFKILKS